MGRTGSTVKFRDAKGAENYDVTRRRRVVKCPKGRSHAGLLDALDYIYS